MKREYCSTSGLEGKVITEKYFTVESNDRQASTIILLGHDCYTIFVKTREGFIEWLPRCQVSSFLNNLSQGAEKFCYKHNILEPEKPKMYEWRGVVLIPYPFGSSVKNEIYRRVKARSEGDAREKLSLYDSDTILSVEKLGEVEE